MIQSENRALIELRSVTVVVDGATTLGPLSWQIEPDQRWVVLGPNGSGKSTLLRLCSLAQHPTAGSVHVFGKQLGRVDIRALKSRIGISSSGLADQLRPRLTAEEIVRCGKFAALEPWWHSYDEADSERARRLLADVGLAEFGPRSFATLSSGERQRTLLARSLMAEPDVVVLDEPTAGLDFSGRETLLAALDSVAAAGGPPVLLVTHHVEDIPASTTHLLALDAGKVRAAGPIGEVLTSALLGELFRMDVTLKQHGSRWSARAGHA